jgi:tRNA modification GTPase
VVAGEVGLALDALAQLTGEDASTALLDSIFARFCIGK